MLPVPLHLHGILSIEVLYHLCYNAPWNFRGGVDKRFMCSSDLKTEIEKRHKKDRRKRLIKWSCLVFVLLLACGFGFLVFRFYNNLNPEIKVEAGTSLPNSKEFLEYDGWFETCDTDIKAIDPRVPGRYPVDFSWLFFHKTAELVIVDTVAPEGEVHDITCTLGEKPKPEDFIVSINDITEVEVRYVLQPDFKKEGDRSVSLVLEDRGGNQTILKANLSIYDENNTPVIKGAKNLHVFTGESVSYRSGVSVVSKVEPAPTLEIDNSAVNLDQQGSYPVTYSATDKYGRSSSVTVQIQVEDKPENYEDIQLMYEEADKLLASILTPEMDDMQKLFAIFRWVRLNIPWSGGRSEHDEVGQVMNGLAGKPGDCYTDAVTMRVLLDRAGFTSLMIEKNNETGMHYWLMVYYDGNWYHVDPTPVYITQFVTFLSTDAQIQIDSDKYRPHFYDRDTRMYPATPTTSPCKVTYKDKDYILEVGEWTPGLNTEAN